MLDSDKGADRTAEFPNQSVQGPLELRQTRELTAREWGDFMRLLREHTWPAPTGRWFSAVSYLWWFIAAYFGISIVAAVQTLHPVAQDLALQLAITGIAFCILLFGFSRVSDRIRAKRLRARDTDTVFLIEPDGFRTKSQLAEIKGYWRAMPAIIETDRYLFVLITGSIGSIIVKSAFDGQDVAAFCAEVQRRWKSGRQSEP